MLKTIIQKFLIISCLVACAQSFAVGEGFYFGLKLGPASNNGEETVAQTGVGTTTPAFPKSSQFGTRLFLGNKFNKYAGMEFGYNYFSKIKYDTRDVQTCSTPGIRVTNLDLTFKGDYPIRSFDIFAKAGVAFMFFDETGSLNPDLTSDCGESRRVFRYKPTFSAGVGYGLTQNWVVDASWDHLPVGGMAKSIDFVGIGISYHFVNVYCGQFLC